MALREYKLLSFDWELCGLQRGSLCNNVGDLCACGGVRCIHWVVVLVPLFNTTALI